MYNIIYIKLVYIQIVWIYANGAYKYMLSVSSLPPIRCHHHRTKSLMRILSSCKIIISFGALFTRRHLCYMYILMIFASAYILYTFHTDIIFYASMALWIITQRVCAVHAMKSNILYCAVMMATSLCKNTLNSNRYYSYIRSGCISSSQHQDQNRYNNVILWID